MSTKFECLITEATRTHASLSFAFDLVHEADEQRMLALIGNELSKRKIRCTIDIGGAKPNAAMIIDRWSEGPLTYCMPEDVEMLEAQNAELLKALEEIMKQTDQRSNYLIDHVYLIARFAIAKAKDEPPC